MEEHSDIIWDGADEPIAEQPVQRPVPAVEVPQPVGILEDDDAPVEIYQPGDSIDESQQMLTPERRQEILGKLVEFELQLSTLSPLMQGFVLAYLQDPTNQAACARKAGYSEHTSKIKGSQLMADSRIQAAIALGQQLREDRTMVTSDRTLNELAIIAFSDISNYEISENRIVAAEGVPDYVMRAVSQAEYIITTKEDEKGNTITTSRVKVKLWSKIDALRMLAQYQKLLTPDGITSNNLHLHKHEHHTWKVGDKELTF